MTSIEQDSVQPSEGHILYPCGGGSTGYLRHCMDNRATATSRIQSIRRNDFHYPDFLLLKAFSAVNCFARGNKMTLLIDKIRYT